MARWIFLVTPNIKKLEELSRRFAEDALFNVSGESESAVLITPAKDSGQGERVQLEPYSLEEFRNECDESQLPLLPSEDAGVFFVKWKGDAFLRSAVSMFKSEPGALIDNDHGLILPVPEFLDWWAKNPTAPIG